MDLAIFLNNFSQLHAINQVIYKIYMLQNFSIFKKGLFNKYFNLSLPNFSLLEKYILPIILLPIQRLANFYNTSSI